MQPLSIPYKALSRCNIEELAAQQMANERKRQTGGIAFARKAEHSEKDAARTAIVEALTMSRYPGRIDILSMPGMSWNFETAVLRNRDENWRVSGVHNTAFTCIENDRFVFYSQTTRMPGLRLGTMRSIERPLYAERAMGNSIIERFVFANVDDLMAQGTEKFDAAWLDYTGPMNVERMRLIRRFWEASVRDLLVVTTLKARWNKETSRMVDRHGGILNWHRNVLPGIVEHEIEYQDGASPMAQFAIRKANHG